MSSAALESSTIDSKAPPNSRVASRIPAPVSAAASALVWGSGQLLNRQPLKALFFFAFWLTMLAVELSTGHYASGLAGFSPRENGGFFVRGLWGLITLGTQPREMGLTGLTEGDNSIFLMVQGIISLLVLALLVGMWVWSVHDAYGYARRLNEGAVAETSASWFRNIWHSAFAYIAIAPGILLVVFMSILPVIFGILVAFTNYSRGNLPPMNLVRWVGFDNFVAMLSVPTWTRTFLGVLAWTVVWAILATLTTYALGFLQAVLLSSRQVKFPRIWRSIFLLPWAVPAMVSALVFRSMFNGQFGPISQFLVDHGITAERVFWFTDPSNPNLARGIALLVNLWLGFPYFMALISGILTSISPSYYEAARLDGASAWQQLRYITLPMVNRTAAPLLVLAFVSNFNNFGVIYFLTEGGPANPNYQFAGNTDLLITWLFKMTLDNRLYNMAAVMSMFIFVIVATVSVWNLRRTSALKEL